jgi:hypothetical protein
LPEILIKPCVIEDSINLLLKGCGKIARRPNTKDLKKVRISLIRGNYQNNKRD